jgi:phage replication O-like protein O
MGKEAIPAMVNPQVEAGHTRLANEILEALCRINLSAYETRTLFALWRKTYGWQKKEDSISVTQFQKLTGLKRQHQSRALKELETRKIVTRIGDGFINTYRFNKDYTTWKTITKRGDDKKNGETVTRIGDTLSPELVTILSPELVTTKEKRNYTKEKGDSMPSLKTLDRFLKDKAEELYKSYPKTADPKNSLKSIEKILKAYPAELLPCPVSGLKLIIQNYQKIIEAKGTGRDYIIQSNNFFGQDERWKEFLQSPQVKGSEW